MSKWRPPEVREVMNSQIFIPKSYGQDILSIAHKTHWLIIWESGRLTTRALKIFGRKLKVMFPNFINLVFFLNWPDFGSSELSFGYFVHGPLEMLKEIYILTEDSGINLLDYFFDCEVARYNLQSTQSKIQLMQVKISNVRTFQSGDKVLSLLPILQNPVQVRYYGPYTVLKKVI